jgi:transcriptional regulator with XRE-family HTH domain
MPQKKHIDIFMKNIFRRIAEIRRERGITQEKLAEIMNVAPREIQRWESIGGLSLQTLKRFSEALECHPAEFFKNSQDPKNNKNTD